jgi:zinc and cadmium transporter
MLATTFLHTLPEAFKMTRDPAGLFGTVLAGLMGFFLLEKLSILRHSHRYHGADHEKGHGQREAGSTGWMILIGDGFHNFTDGIMIAAAFMADFKLGILTSLAIFAHEIPQEAGDFMVLLNAGFSRTRAYLYNLLCSLLALAGGLIGYYTLGRVQHLIPYALAVAAAGFIYIAVSDLIPQMQRRSTLKETLSQVILIAAGIAIIFTITQGFGLHNHAH